MGDEDGPHVSMLDVDANAKHMLAYAIKKFGKDAAARLPAELYRYVVERHRGTSTASFNSYYSMDAQKDIDNAVADRTVDSIVSRLKERDEKAAVDASAATLLREKNEKAHEDLIHRLTHGGPMFGLAYSPIQVSAFGNLALPSLDFGGSEKFTAFM